MYSFVIIDGHDMLGMMEKLLILTFIIIIIIKRVYEITECHDINQCKNM